MKRPTTIMFSRKQIPKNPNHLRTKVLTNLNRLPTIPTIPDRSNCYTQQVVIFNSDFTYVFSIVRRRAGSSLKGKRSSVLLQTAEELDTNESDQLTPIDPVMAYARPRPIAANFSFGWILICGFGKMESTKYQKISNHVQDDKAVRQHFINQNADMHRWCQIQDST